jgi:hypothetical protein
MWLLTAWAFASFWKNNQICKLRVSLIDLLKFLLYSFSNIFSNYDPCNRKGGAIFTTATTHQRDSIAIRGFQAKLLISSVSDQVPLILFFFVIPILI